ncbi:MULTISPECIES: lasso RiPP family leader peptide-containing protein [unclassified Streptomyces]|uniref:lasso RiPP family leader peptide-containing protein n=1 Tax=unclassified Streptomyces TaxID=2593676 RepID=UPI0033B9BE3D
MTHQKGPCHLQRKGVGTGEVSHIEEAEVYEPPVLVEAGSYAEATRGYAGWVWDGFSGFLTPGG